MKKFGSVGSYVLVALLAALATVFAVKQTGYSGSQKLNQLLSLIDERFIEDVDTAELEDAAAEAMINRPATNGAIISRRRSIPPM